MASHSSIYQEARDRIEKDISGIVLCLNEKKNSLFREIAVLENEYKSKQQQKQTSLRKLESLKDHTEEELGDNLLSEIQGHLTQEIQSGIDKLNHEITSLTIDYSIQIDWRGVEVVKEMIKDYTILIIPKKFESSVSHYQFFPSDKAKEKTKRSDRGRYSSANGTGWGHETRENDNWGDETWGDETWGDEIGRDDTSSVSHYQNVPSDIAKENSRTKTRFERADNGRDWNWD